MTHSEKVAKKIARMLERNKAKSEAKRLRISLAEYRMRASHPDPARRAQLLSRAKPKRKWKKPRASWVRVATMRLYPKDFTLLIESLLLIRANTQAAYKWEVLTMMLNRLRAAQKRLKSHLKV